MTNEEAKRWVRMAVKDLRGIDSVCPEADSILTALTAPGEGLREAIRAFSDELDDWTNARPVPPVDFMTMQFGPKMVAAWDRVIRALAAPAPQEEAKKPCAEITLTAGAWRSLVAGLDEEGAEHETPITVCYDAEHDQGIYCYAEYPDDGARTIDPAPPAREDAKFPAPFEGCDHTAPERVEACWHAQLCPICATKNWHAAQRELKQRRSATPASAPELCDACQHTARRHGPDGCDANGGRCECAGFASAPEGDEL